VEKLNIHEKALQSVGHMFAFKPKKIIDFAIFFLEYQIVVLVPS